MNNCLVVFDKNGFTKINANRIDEREGMVYAYDGETLVGIFDLGTVDKLYLSKSAGGQEK